MAGRRLVALASVAVAAALMVLVGPSTPVTAAPQPDPPATSLSNQCSVRDWQNPGNFAKCVGRLQDLSQSRLQCLSPPTPETPDAGLSGWFASEPASASQPGPAGRYSRYGYAGYDFTTYDVGCVSPVTHPASTFEDTVANGEFMFAGSVIGASNALREKAWEPNSLWGWADALVNNATRSIYRQVFTVFGAVTLAVIGLYLMWRSRQSDMSGALTTAGWALLVMVAVTAVATWPVRAAHLADSTLVGGLSVVHNAIGPENASIPADQCPDATPGACTDHRPPAVRASDTATENMLYRNWLRGLLGSADSPTAIKYGPVLYDARSLSWSQAAGIAAHPDTRAAVIAQKQQEWVKVAEQIKTEDPQAYDYLQGNQGMDRIGAGFIAILSSLFFGMFDITASILVLIGFLIFRWAVIAAPVLGTVGLLRPASSGIRRLANAVVAATFNIVIFGTGAAVYLYAVGLIMGTATLPGWLQVVLVWLVGVVGWLLLRPYRRITQLGGKDPTAAVAGAGSWHRRFFRDARDAARLDPAAPADATERRALGRRPKGALELRQTRPESRTEDAYESRSSAAPAQVTSEPAVTSSRPSSSSRHRPAGDWTESDVPDVPSNYSVYRPGANKSASTTAPTTEPKPARRPESSRVGG
jgi:hypothetical protein